LNRLSTQEEHACPCEALILQPVPKDVAYLVAHFNAKAPIAGEPVDTKWVGVYGANGAVDLYGDRICTMEDIVGAVQHFNHKANMGKP